MNRMEHELFLIVDFTLAYGVNYYLSCLSFSYMSGTFSSNRNKWIMKTLNYSHRLMMTWIITMKSLQLNITDQTNYYDKDTFHEIEYSRNEDLARIHLNIRSPSAKFYSVNGIFCALEHWHHLFHWKMTDGLGKLSV